MSHFINCLIITAFTALLFLKTIRYGYVPDDEHAARSAEIYKDLIRKNKPLNNNTLRILVYGAGLFKNKTHDHMFTIGLNAVIGLLIYACFQSLAVSLLWLAHPINNQVTIWLNGRRYQISIILGLVSAIYPPIGTALYAVALYFHPIAMPFILVPMLKGNFLPVLWLVPCIMLTAHYKNWILSRFDIQPFAIYKRFEIGKISLGIRALGEYLIHLIAPKGFVMYHPRIWGIAELPGNRARNFATDVVLMGYGALILFTLVMVCLGGRSSVGYGCLCLTALLPWLGFVVNPVQLWAQRYASVASLFFLLAIQVLAPSQHLFLVNCVLLTYYTAVTLKDMGMYRSFFDFFLFQTINDPMNQNAHYFGAVGIENEGARFKEDKKPLEALMCSAYATAIGFHWCMYNPKPDLIHDFLKQKLQRKS